MGNIRVLGGSRGNFKKVDIGKVSDSLVVFAGINPSSYSAFVQTVTLNKAEKVGMLQCFNDTNHVYAFGHDPEGSKFSCTMIVFMNKCDEEGFTEGFTASGGLAKLIEEYEEKRVSNRKQTVDLKVDDGKTLTGILVGMSSRVEDPELNMFSVTFICNDMG